MNSSDNCPIISNETQLNETLKNNQKAVILFYASWCPFSQRFLPSFLESAKKNKQSHLRVLIDDCEELAEKYQIEIYPTVLYFINGEVSARLDGIAHQGLTASALNDFLNSCN